MKKHLTVAVSALLIIAALPGLVAGAFFGSGVEVMAEGAEVVRTALLGEKICFKDTDFKCALAIENFGSLTITELPKSSEGTLLFAGRRVREGQTIKRKNIASLVFVPSSKSVTESKFKFTIEGACGGQELVCTMKFIEKVNYAPTADTEETVLTQASISLFERMYAKDPEGDVLTYMVVRYPKYGTLKFSEDSGKYKYTPLGEYVGEDSFIYVVRDEYGNYTKPITVKIEVAKRMSEVVYRDMTEREEYGAAVAMTAMGVMSGKTVGKDAYFNPDATVTRAEFVSMAMKALGIRCDSTVTTSCFDDNADIPVSLVGYVATAQRLGYINGTFVSGSLIFRPNDVITKYEAAKILAEMLGDSVTGESAVFADIDTVPVWARPGVYAMYSLGIFSSFDGNIYGNAGVSRAECAGYLYKACLAREKDL